MQWVWGVRAIVGIATYLVVFGLLIRYARRNGRDYRRLHRGPGCGRSFHTVGGYLAEDEPSPLS